VTIKRRATKTKGTVFDIRLRDPSGKVYGKTHPTEAKAKAWERAELVARDRGTWIDPRMSKRIFSDIAAEWADSNPRKRQSTVARDRSTLDHHVLPAIGSRRIQSITTRDIQALVKEMAATLAPSTVERNYRMIAAVFRFATDRKYLHESPCVKVGLPRVPKAKAHVLTPEELAMLADAMPVEYYAMVWVGAVLGLRWGEVAALRVMDVNLLAKELHVRQTLTRGLRGYTEVGEPKSEAAVRTLPIPHALAEVLSAHLATMGFTATDPEAYLFTSPKGGLLVQGNWQRRVWYPAAVAAGVGSIDHPTGRYNGPTFHDLRRTSATGLVAAGVDVKTAQTRLGHSTVRLTLDVYAQVVEQRDREASETLSEQFKPRLRVVDSGTTRDKRAIGPADGSDYDTDDNSDQGVRGGRGGTRTPDICLVRAAL
jgi:integrase